MNEIIGAPADWARYVALLESIQRPGDVALDVAARGEQEWTVAICTADFLGALALIVGLFAAYRLTILNADIRTLSFSEPRGGSRRGARTSARRAGPVALPAPTHRLLDVFDVRALADPSPRLWESFRADLAALLVAERSEAAQEEIISRVSEALLATGDESAKLFPITIDVSDENVTNEDVSSEVSIAPASEATKLTVRSADSPGVLFALANALAGFPLNVERAEIRTVNGEALDAFWVTDIHRRPIVDEKRIAELRVATTLIKHFTYLLPRSPNPGQALRQFNSLISQMRSRPAWTGELTNLDSLEVLETLADLLGMSRFLWEDFLRMQHESLFPVLLDAGALARARPKANLREELRRRLARVSSDAERVPELNAFKDREMFRIDLRHIVGRSGFAEFSQELTWLAEIAVEAAIGLAQQEFLPKFGRPTLADGRICPWCLCALGKFGGAELGFGSDLELHFLFEDQGYTDGPSSIVNSEYFVQLVQTFLRTLRARQEGVFEIDLRLRPFGRAGALASSVEGFERYYSRAGAAEQFERLALVRLRPVAGDDELASRIRRARDAFVYSGEPLDLGNILHLRHRQANELVPRGQVNAKYSSGGLVDLEYFVQAWQIVAGAVESTLRVTNTLEAIRRLARGGYLRADLAEEMRDTYDFMRRLIDALRVVRGNAKDLTIPSEQSREFAYLARRLKLVAPRELQEAIATRMARARALWSDAPPPT